MMKVLDHKSPCKIKFQDSSELQDLVEMDPGKRHEISKYLKDKAKNGGILLEFHCKGTYTSK